MFEVGVGGYVRQGAQFAVGQGKCFTFCWGVHLNDV